MPVSQGAGGGIPGTMLKAWVVIQSDGTIVKSYNVSSVVHNSAGNYTVTFTAAMQTTSYTVVFYGNGESGNASALWNSKTKTTGSFIALSGWMNGGNATAVDSSGVWAVYE